MSSYASANGRSGFTLVEVLVAVVLFSFGMLAVARILGSSALALNQSGRISLATAAVSSRAGLLAIEGCRDRAGSDEPAPGIRVRWRVTGGTPGRAETIAQYSVRGRPRSDTLRTTLWCGP